MNRQEVYSLKFIDNKMYAGTGSGIYISTNGGQLWVQTSLSNQIVFSLAVNGSNIFAGTCYSGILRSTNNGMNWIQTSISNATIYDIIICGNAVLAGAGGVYRSTNNG